MAEHISPTEATASAALQWMYACMSSVHIWPAPSRRRLHHTLLYGLAVY